MSDEQYVLFESSEGRLIDEVLARRLVDSQFPQWSHLPITAVDLDGWDNRSFRLGSELTVRLPGGNWYAEQVDAVAAGPCGWRSPRSSGISNATYPKPPQPACEIASILAG